MSATSSRGVVDAIPNLSRNPSPSPSPSAPEPTGYRIELLGGFRCTGPTGPIELPAGGQRIVALVALAGTALDRATVARSLWPGQAEARALAALRRQLWRVAPVHGGLLVIGRTTVALGAGVVVDAADERERFGRFLATPLAEVDPSLLDDVVRRAERSRDLLPGWYDEWVIAEQERWHRARLQVLERASVVFRGSSRWSAAVDTALAASATDPFRESAVQALVEAHAAEGNALAALRCYEAYRRQVVDELGVDPLDAAGGAWIDGVLRRLRSAPGVPARRVDGVG